MYILSIKIGDYLTIKITHSNNKSTPKLKLRPFATKCFPNSNPLSADSGLALWEKTQEFLQDDSGYRGHMFAISYLFLMIGKGKEKALSPFLVFFRRPIFSP